MFVVPLLSGAKRNDHPESGARQIELLLPIRDEQTEVRYSSTSHPCWRKLATAVKIRSTNRLPLSLCVPNDFRRHSTARLNGISALVLLDEKHQRGADRGGRPVPVFFTDSKLVECQHGVRLAWVLGNVYEFGIFLRPQVNGYIQNNSFLWETA